MSEKYTYDLIGIGSPVMDLLASVSEKHMVKVAGEKGGMVLVDADEMKTLVAQLASAPDTSTGGSAANTTLNANRLGLKTTFLGKLGNDDHARNYRERFAAVGVDPSRFKHGDHPNAQCLALVTPDTERTMRTCLGAAMTLSPDEISVEDFRGCRHAHIEGYLVFNRDLADAVLSAARAAGCTVSLDLASFEVVGASRDWLFSQFKTGLDVVFANEDEIKALYESDESYDLLARRLAGEGVVAAVKVGKDGAWIAESDELHRIEPVTISDAIDTNGAGDSWAAGFLSGYIRGMGHPVSGKIASHIGAETVRHLGPIIPDEHFTPLARHITTLKTAT